MPRLSPSVIFLVSGMALLLTARIVGYDTVRFQKKAAVAPGFVEEVYSLMLRTLFLVSGFWFLVARFLFDCCEPVWSPLFNQQRETSNEKQPETQATRVACVTAVTRINTRSTPELTPAMVQ